MRHFCRVLSAVLFVAVLLGLAVPALALGTTTAVAETTTRAGIDWGHGVTTDVVVDWAITIACCIGGIFVLSALAATLVIEKKKK